MAAHQTPPPTTLTICIPGAAPAHEPLSPCRVVYSGAPLLQDSLRDLTTAVNLAHYAEGPSRKGWDQIRFRERLV
jgi:hypothetical protein